MHENVSSAKKILLKEMAFSRTEVHYWLIRCYETEGSSLYEDWIGGQVCIDLTT